MEPTAAFKNSVKAYREQRRSLSRLIQEYVNKNNQLTFVSNEMMQSAAGADVKASRSTFRLNDQLEELRSNVTSTLSDVASAIQNMIVSKMKMKASCDVDQDFIDSILSQIQQQHLLESTVVAKITGMDSLAIDQDSMVTMLACFEYPPYLQEADLDALVSTN